MILRKWQLFEYRFFIFCWNSKMSKNNPQNQFDNNTILFQINTSTSLSIYFSQCDVKYFFQIIWKLYQKGTKVQEEIHFNLNGRVLNIVFLMLILTAKFFFQFCINWNFSFITEGWICTLSPDVISANMNTILLSINDTFHCPFCWKVFYALNCFLKIQYEENKFISKSKTNIP